MSLEPEKSVLVEFVTIRTYRVGIPCICISIFNVRDMAHLRTDDLNNALLNDVSSSAVRPSQVSAHCIRSLESSTCSGNLKGVPVIEAVADISPRAKPVPY